jgi:peptidoglycan/xylan/chitin deacetylase (PgdA/CDA1 family)
VVAVAAGAALLAVLTVVLVLSARRNGEPTASAPTATAPSSVSSTQAPPTTTGALPPSRSSPTTTTPGTTPPPLPPELRGREVTVLPTVRHVVALTFDAGGDAAGLASILGTLSAQHVRATFFLTGRWTADHRDAVRAILAGGSRIGNHTVTHPHLPALSDAQVRAEVLGAQATIQAAGADPRPLFRFPFGDRDARTIADVNALGYVPVGWTVDTLGWEGTAGGMSAQRVADRAVAALRPGEIVLMHVGANPDDGTTFDADALASTIARMRSAGYDFVTLDSLLAP